MWETVDKDVTAIEKETRFENYVLIYTNFFLEMSIFCCDITKNEKEGEVSSVATVTFI